MWIFLLSDTFIFTCFLTSYMNVRISTTGPLAESERVFALNIGNTRVPLILIAIMTMILITSRGPWPCRELRLPSPSRVYHGPDADTAAFGATFVGMQAFEWTKLITEGVRPWGIPGAPQFGSSFFMITGFHGLHVSAGVIYLNCRGSQGLARIL